MSMSMGDTADKRIVATPRATLVGSAGTPRYSGTPRALSSYVRRKKGQQEGGAAGAEGQDGGGKLVKGVALPGIGSKDMGMVRTLIQIQPRPPWSIEKLSFVYPPIQKSVHLSIWCLCLPRVYALIHQ
jgi:hypothetical protein